MVREHDGFPTLLKRAVEQDVFYNNSSILSGTSISSNQGAALDRAAIKILFLSRL